MWKNFIDNISDDYHFNEPASKSAIEKINAELNVVLPNELIQFLTETDGARDKFGCYLIWSANKIVKENKEIRSCEVSKEHYMPFENLLFIADAGNGDLFAYRILNGLIEYNDIYCWDHETDSRKWVAPSLKDFIKGWITSEISI
jgi:hypothetical protein